jgi:large subunit ribosomal protein L4
MATVQVRNIENKVVEELTLSDEIFAAPENHALIHQVVKATLANHRQGTVMTKGRSDVAGGRSKPFRQKGTGRARQGTIRAAQFRGGGVTFGPKPRDHRQDLNRKMRRLALCQALSMKMRDNALIVVDALSFDEPKTGRMSRILKDLEIKGKALLVLDPPDLNTLLSARNIPTLQMDPPHLLSVNRVMNAQALLLTKDAILKVAEVLS